MAERLHRPQDDHRAARSPDPPLRYHRNRKRQLALQEPWRRPSHNPRSRRLRNPDQLRRRERYRPDSSLKRVKIGRRPRVKFGRRLTAWDDDPAQRASHWIMQQGNQLKIISDFESVLENLVFPQVWERFGWSHSPGAAQGPVEAGRDLPT